MLENIEYSLIKSQNLPIISDLIFGKIFDYKYYKQSSLKHNVIKLQIDVEDNINGAIYFISQDLNKNEKLCEEKFSDYKNLEKELNFLYNYPIIKEDLDHFKWDIESIPKYPAGYIYFFKLIIKEDLIIDFNLLSAKTKLYHKLNKKMHSKDKQLRRKI